MRKKTALPKIEELSTLDYYKIIVSGLLVVLGVVILYRSVLSKPSPLSILFSLSLLGFGIYRIRVIVDYFKEKGSKR